MTGSTAPDLATALEARSDAPLVLCSRWLGNLPYARGLALQDEWVVARREGRVGDTLLLLEHPPVITLGRAANPEHVRLGDAERRARGIELHETGRGGDVTYHGPGQLVGYPIVALEGARRDLHRYLRDLESGLIRAMADFGILAGRAMGLTGVWVGDCKLAAIGVRVSTGWVTSHGFALNVTTDLDGFRSIVPCGIRDRGVTSMARILGRTLPLRLVADRVSVRLAEALGFDGSEWLAEDTGPNRGDEGQR